MKQILTAENIVLNAKVDNQEEAIKLAGKVLVENGYVNEHYISKMLEREQITSTYMGNHIAIPHGTEEGKKDILSSGISIIQIPEGVEYGEGNIVKVVFGIAGKDNEHLELLSKIAILCSEEENVNRIINAATKEELINLFNEVE